MRALLITLLVLAAAAVGADRVAEQVATGRAEDRLAGQGVTDPRVDVAGFPFLTQLLSHHFDDVRMSATRVEVDGARGTRVYVRAADLDVPSSGDATAGRVRARALISYEEVLRRAGVQGLRLSPAGAGRVRVTGTVRLLGNPIEVVSLCRVRVADGRLQVSPTSIELAGGGPLDARLSSSLSAALTLSYSLSLRDLPEGVTVRRVTPTPAGFQVSLAGTDVSFDPAMVR